MNRGPDFFIKHLLLNTTAQDFGVCPLLIFYAIRKQCSYAFDNIRLVVLLALYQRVS